MSRIILLVALALFVTACNPGGEKAATPGRYNSRTVHVYTDDGRVLECQRGGIVKDRFMIDCKEMPPPTTR